LTVGGVIWYCVDSVRQNERQDDSTQASGSRPRAAPRAAAGFAAGPSRVSGDALPALRSCELSLCGQGGAGARPCLLFDGHRRPGSDAADLRPPGTQDGGGGVDRELPPRAREARADLDAEPGAAEARRAVRGRLGGGECAPPTAPLRSRSRYRADAPRRLPAGAWGERRRGYRRGEELWPRSSATCCCRRRVSVARSSPPGPGRSAR
jgi:hypothetical protein